MSFKTAYALVEGLDEEALEKCLKLPVPEVVRAAIEVRQLELLNQAPATFYRQRWERRWP